LTLQNVIRYALAAAILAVGMVASSALISRFFVRVQQEKEIRVTGYAECMVTSDIGQLQADVNARGPDRPAAYKAVRAQADAVAAGIRKTAPGDATVSLANADVEAVYRINDKGERTSEVASYLGTQVVLVVSSDVRWVKQLSWDLNELIGQGYDVTVQSPTFIVSSLDETKRDLLQKATADGYRRAKMLAENSGARVGCLRSARQGVFQITEPNSTDTSDYGVYDTSTIAKSIKAVVSLEYGVD
jgi:hypothetical protein